MSSPISNQVGTVLIPVKNLQRSAVFYTKILGQPLGKVRGPVYNLNIVGPTRVALDCDNFNDVIRNGEVNPSSHPLFTFETTNIELAHQFLLENNVEVDNIQLFGNTGLFHLKDLDGNIIMVHGAKVYGD
ncbi:catechol 2,3-dioxygenase-like lactoylglutathione lyase family enzyme [Salirhabdus euzebyi]|uniref:Catechol 2,3-dioxygenase-like lactoylglutathione lyase family enzyme n=1 Tax=Salirhabdus euzebyi TaxID=394506 RepID=A0A841PX22_9BACI|nr:VOC family protein [Salirhabdus euzebyi]MBB6452514.1 catechol 2,3-dioxygenase-like lactoylglutathione lyase family enzyme [Salirhabdus euzebyi]